MFSGSPVTPPPHTKTSQNWGELTCHAPSLLRFRCSEANYFCGECSFRRRWRWAWFVVLCFGPCKANPATISYVHMYIYRVSWRIALIKVYSQPKPPIHIPDLHSLHDLNGLSYRLFGLNSRLSRVRVPASPFRTHLKALSKQ